MIYLLGTTAQIYKIANLKVLFPVLYMVALFEPKMKIENTTSWTCTKTCCILELSFLISGGIRKYYIVYAFVTDFLRRKHWKN